MIAFTAQAVDFPWINLYGSLLVLAFGACVGSFLNVIIYRWPRDLSIRRPLWSFCPHCRSTLGWYDNLPVLSYLLLRARCRYCKAPISLQYPFVELATAFSFLLIYDAFFVAKLRWGISDLSVDWPILLAHWALAAGLIVLTVMDLEQYLVDIRVTWILTGIGLFLHSLWTPASSSYHEGWIRPGAIQAAMAAAATLGLGIGAMIFLRRQHEPLPEDSDEAIHADEAPSSATPSSAADGSEPVSSSEASQQITGCNSVPASKVWLWTLLGGLLIAAYVATMLYQEHQAFLRLLEPVRDSTGRLVWRPSPEWDPGLLRTAAGLIVLFISLTAFASHPHPEEDEEIIESLAAEAPSARRNALWELGLLAPAVLLAVAAATLLVQVPGLRARADAALHFTVVGHWAPLWGLSTALVGWIIGGAIAWLTRAAGTIGLGKEALGMGDVHIMAGVGAIAGAWVAVLGFFMASPLALLGILAIQLRRQSRALPFGPWLALGAFLVMLYQDRILPYLQIADLLR